MTEFIYRDDRGHFITLAAWQHRERLRRRRGIIVRATAVISLIAAWFILMAGLAFANDGATTLQLAEVYDAQDIAFLILVGGLALENFVRACRGK